MPDRATSSGTLRALVAMLSFAGKLPENSGQHLTLIVHDAGRIDGQLSVRTSCRTHRSGAQSSPEHEAFVAALHLAMQALQAFPQDRQVYMSVNAAECTRNCDATELGARTDSLHRVAPSYIHNFLQRAVRRMH